jgi:neutral ceramidase
VGYVDTPERVEAREGEARRQYFSPSLLERLGAGAELAAEAAGFTR